MLIREWPAQDQPKQKLKSKAVTLLATFEIARRILSVPVAQKIRITDPEVIFQHLGPLLSHLKRELFLIMTLNSANKLIRQVKITEGILNSSLVHPREVFRPAILESAASIIPIHNHPSSVRLYGVINQRLMERT